MGKRGGLAGQAALEFLMTYGWAILIMLVVIAVLFLLGVFNSSTSVPSSCVLPSGFTCAEFYLDSSGRLYLDLGQATGKTVNVNGVGCGSAGSGVTSLSLPVTVQTGSHAVVSDSDVTCSGNYSGAFKGKISIRYQPAGASYNKTITGDLSAPVAVVAAGEQGQWNTSYGYYRQVTVNTGVSSNLTDFPAYFILDTQHLIAWGRMNSSCKDLRVVNSTKNGVMDYEIENNTCNTTNTVVWFRVPQTNAANDYTAYVFYGNNSSSDAQNKAGVWSNGFVAVYHLGGDASDSAGANGGAVTGAVAASSGKIGGAYQFDGVDDVITCGSGASLNIMGDLTVSAWGKANPLYSGGDNRNLAGHNGAYWTTGNTYALYVQKDATKFIASVRYGSNTSNPGNEVYDRFTGGSLSVGSWHHAALTKNSTKLAIFADGSMSSSVDAPLPIYSNPASVFYIGNSPDGRTVNGTIDEVRISNVQRSSDWISAEYGQTYSVGSEQVN